MKRLSIYAAFLIFGSKCFSQSQDANHQIVQTIPGCYFAIMSKDTSFIVPGTKIRLTVKTGDCFPVKDDRGEYQISFTKTQMIYHLQMAKGVVFDVPSSFLKQILPASADTQSIYADSLERMVDEYKAHQEEIDRKIAKLKERKKELEKQEQQRKADEDAYYDAKEEGAKRKEQKRLNDAWINFLNRN